MVSGDYVMTIDSDDEAPIQPTKAKDESVQLDMNFVFDPSVDTLTETWNNASDLGDLVKTGSRPAPISVDDIIARRKQNQVSKKRKRPPAEEEEDQLSGSEVDSGGDDDHDSDESEFARFVAEDAEDPLASSGEEGEDLEVIQSEDQEDQDGVENDEGQSDSSEESEEDETQVEKDRKAAFFADYAGPSEKHESFLHMNLSRPILKALTSLGFVSPTPIQAATIPVALLGKDVVGNAVTGSGKTAAFIIPVIERLLYRERGKKAAATRCLILVPTRELGVQCYEVGKKLSVHTDIRFCLAVGGLSLKSQEAELRTFPDIVIATPGRLIDHLRNSIAFSLDTLDVLILDEADRMLEDGFADELAEIIKSCPQSRQTMLFSATMTDSVDELVRMSLDKPVRLFVDPKRTTARGLMQEFVRVRAGKEADRSALLVSLCKRTFKQRTIIFFRSKKLAHQMRIVFGLLGLKSDELHGDLTQEQRLRALQTFRDGTVDYLMATDLASRGLDIKGVETVVNFDMPGQLAQYLHRVGRTARAGKKGRSVTLVGEADRRMLKAAIKHSAGEDQVRHRVVPPDAVARYAEKLESLKDEIAEIMKEEKEEKLLRQAEMELKRGQNILEHGKEIYSRPARTWFQSEKEKQVAQAVSKQQYESATSLKKSERNQHAPETNKPKRDKFSGLTRRAKRRKTAMEEDETDQHAIGASIRSAKKAMRPKKIGLPEPRPQKMKAKKTHGQKKQKNAGSFDHDLGQRTKPEGIRAKKGDSVGRAGKRPRKSR
ncbi:DEAD-domain-containing protein [Thelephora terrestris]|uniref:ATP-dependent RNA helicase DRS1 n=1 Tax=Thelephora terrestris TaxID=56493 RepID=A0A9P6HEX7_9AGAM|nr:DEAD-domain-containing protein [Thelephora terrestris]